MNATQNGVPIIECGKCGLEHPKTRQHCPVCGMPTLFPLIHCGPIRRQADWYWTIAEVKEEAGDE